MVDFNKGMAFCSIILSIILVIDFKRSKRNRAAIILLAIVFAIFPIFVNFIYPRMGLNP